jgi:hypothetical protein
MRNYGGDRSIIGSQSRLTAPVHTVVGVMPASFRFQFWSGLRELWVPANWTAGDQDPGIEFIHLHWPREARRDPGAGAQRDGYDRPRHVARAAILERCRADRR